MSYSIIIMSIGIARPLSSSHKLKMDIVPAIFVFIFTDRLIPAYLIQCTVITPLWPTLMCLKSLMPISGRADASIRINRRPLILFDRKQSWSQQKQCINLVWFCKVEDPSLGPILVHVYITNWNIEGYGATCSSMLYTPLYIGAWSCPYTNAIGLI